jgi:carbon monoxide dehydrogenase subunit G
VKIEEVTLVKVPRSEAFRFAALPENMPRWNPGVIESTAIGPLGKGTTVVQTCRVLGRRFETAYRVTSFRPPHRITFTSVRGPMKVQATMEFVPAGGATKVRWTVDGDCLGFLHVGHGVLERVGHLKMHECLQSLARILEDEAVGSRN